MFSIAYSFKSCFFKIAFEFFSVCSKNRGVSGGCVESAVVRESMSLIKDNKPFKKLEFKVSNESAWEIGLACGGEIAVYLEQFN